MFDRYGCPLPRGCVVSSEKEAVEAALLLGLPVMVKAQVLSGGRGKAGGVRKATSSEEVLRATQDIFALTINGSRVTRALVAEAIDIEKEYYLAVTIDRSAKSVRCIMSASGGIDIEQVAGETPEKIKTFQLQPMSPLQDGDGHDELLAVFGDSTAPAKAILQSLVRLFMENDCSLVEVNPLVLTKEKNLIAADGKIVIDENGLYKHPELERYRNREEFGDDELAAHDAHLSFVGLTGTIGCMVNGAGLAMATMDMIGLYGGSPANFLDVGGSSNPRKVVDALRIILRNKSIKVILVNIFGGITRCDDIARGLLQARQELGITLPLVVRLTGTNQVEGRGILAAAGIHAFTDMVGSVRQAVALGGTAP